jgi:hypothetical protein
MGFDISTDSTIRYGVYQAWRVRVVGTSDSVKAPVSAKESAYVLIYPRNPDWSFCAKKYSVVSLKGGARRIVYTDFQARKGKRHRCECRLAAPLGRFMRLKS